MIGKAMFKNKLVSNVLTAAILCLSGCSEQKGKTTASSPKILKISHQFPGGTIENGDFRDRLCRRFAKEVEEKTKGSLKFEIHSNASLMKTNAQFSALRKGALDLSLVPISYSGGEIPELNMGLMPGLVVSYDKGKEWKDKKVGKKFASVVEDKGVVIVSWVWQAGGVASKTKPIINPEDSKDMKIRGGSHEMDSILKKSGAAVVSMPSDEIYSSMQTGAVDAAMTSSTSLMSYKLAEVSKFVTTGRKSTYWFMLEPLMISKKIFDGLSKEEQKIIMDVGAELESFAMEEAKKDDERVADMFKKAGAEVSDLSEESVKKWQDVARDTAWKEYAENPKCTHCKELLELAKDALK